ncbi:DEKNAAC103701 [Brettanomyces naardenensis]|uniref:DEKNAAC103701 n=1 Tax=Brettanomyces naardenensis TaxID=13370 RepID=A0A448YN12_BRENA|nr:DEKNAAC103701 [Brettanomyces naardenensis]
MKFPDLERCSKVWTGLSVAYLRINKVLEALNAITRAMEVSDDEKERDLGTMWLVMGQCNARLYHLQDALKAFQKCLESSPSLQICRRAHTELAEVNIKLGKSDEACKELGLYRDTNEPLQPGEESFRESLKYEAIAYRIILSLERMDDIEHSIKCCAMAEENQYPGACSVDMAAILLLHAYFLLQEDTIYFEPLKAAILLTRMLRMESHGTSEKRDFLPWLLLGMAYKYLGSYQSCLECFQSAVGSIGEERLAIINKELKSAVAAAEKNGEKYISEELSSLVDVTKRKEINYLSIRGMIALTKAERVVLYGKKDGTEKSESKREEQARKPSERSPEEGSQEPPKARASPSPRRRASSTKLSGSSARRAKGRSRKSTSDLPRSIPDPPTVSPVMAVPPTYDTHVPMTSSSMPQLFEQSLDSRPLPLRPSSITTMSSNFAELPQAPSYFFGPSISPYSLNTVSYSLPQQLYPPQLMEYDLQVQTEQQVFQPNQPQQYYQYPPPQAPGPYVYYQ